MLFPFNYRTIEQLVRIELTSQAWKARVMSHYTIAANVEVKLGNDPRTHAYKASIFPVKLFDQLLQEWDSNPRGLRKGL